MGDRADPRENHRKVPRLPPAKTPRMGALRADVYLICMTGPPGRLGPISKCERDGHAGLHRVGFEQTCVSAERRMRPSDGWSMCFTSSSRTAMAQIDFYAGHEASVSAATASKIAVTSALDSAMSAR